MLVKGGGQNRTLVHCRWECKSVQPLWNVVWQFLKTLRQKFHLTLQFHTWVHIWKKTTTQKLIQNISSVQSLSHVRLFVTPWIAAHQASLSITNSWSLLKLMSIESVMPSSHLILCRPLLLLPPIPPSIRVFSNEPTLRIRWPKYWSFSFSISPSNEDPGLISFRMDWLDLLAQSIVPLGSVYAVAWSAVCFF